ncbi:hypothetical protein HME7025_01252 [Aquirufa nivalisilvae]|uniref:Uncharacterized protein n=1 Tax=Aquirufa nivalisilvae TaxID=2516557 RepID=A0A2S2DUN4_9BACT|nr:hypothetical protein HME7025_01252 [Aquirufa nivalisilvae]
MVWVPRETIKLHLSGETKIVKFKVVPNLKKNIFNLFLVKKVR